MDLAQLRSTSNYPAYRLIVSLLVVVGYLAAIVMVAVGFFASAEAPFAWLIGFSAGAAIALATRIVQEVLLMAADATDAILALANRAESGDSQHAPAANLDWN